MWPRLGAALALACVLSASAAAQSPVNGDSAVRVRKDAAAPVRKAPRPLAVRPAPPAPPRLLGTPVSPLLGTPLLEVFDTAQDMETRRLILALVPELPDPVLRRRLILRGVQLSGDRSASFVAGVAVLTALHQLGEEGPAVLREALAQGVVRDERTRRMIEAALRAR